MDQVRPLVKRCSQRPSNVCKAASLLLSELKIPFVENGHSRAKSVRVRADLLGYKSMPRPRIVVPIWGPSP
jgi:hypothetical protein